MTKLILKDKTEVIIDSIDFPANFVKEYASKEAITQTWDLFTSDNLSDFSVVEDDVETIHMTNYALDSMQVVSNYDGTYTVHFYLRDGQYTSVVISGEDQEIIDKVKKFGGFTTETVQSDKIGFDWVIEKLGETILTKTYVEQAIPVGTAENPIWYTEDVELIDNAYYVKDGARYVYMAGEWIEMGNEE